MKITYCNPLDLGYRYQHVKEGQTIYGFREGADPSLIFFKGKYYLFVSMSAGFWYSTDLINWDFHADPNLLIDDYAPDVRQIGEYLYFCASRGGENCPILRTADPLREDFVQVAAPFPFWDPCLFCDDDGRVYFYWGCSNTDPVYGVELDPETFAPIGEKKALIYAHDSELGYERVGIKSLPGERPYIEGAYMIRHQNRYYLQYACPGTEFHTYADGVYVSDSPLGPFSRQKSNPFSSKPGGFITGAGHGSTISDRYGNYWHAATMRISVNHMFERRVGLFPAGIDEDGILYCNQNFADYPFRIPEGKFDAAALKPEWMLLSNKKPAFASSTADGSSASLAVNEDVRTWWSAADNSEGQWLAVDLEKSSDIRAIQVNLADENVLIHSEAEYSSKNGRCIELSPQISHYRVEISSDGVNWKILEQTARECSNGYYERVIGGKLPYNQPLRISGLRIFGNGVGNRPDQVRASAVRTGEMDALVTWEAAEGAQGYNIRYGIAPDKLYQSWMVYDANVLELTTLIKGQAYYICVDSFNENGITEGKTFFLE